MTTEELLQKNLDPSLVKQRQGQPYIEGHTAIDQANRIFGFEGWGYDVVGGPELQRIENMDGKTGEVKYSYAYSAIVRVSAGDAPARTDVGYHPVQANKQGIYTAEAHDTAIKAAVTDGLKRALRSFGAQFGNSLYDKGGRGKPPASRNGSDPANAAPAQRQAQRQAQAPANGNGKPSEATATAAQMRKIHAMGKEDYGSEWEETRDRIFAHFTEGEARPLTKEEASSLIEGLEKRAAEREAEAAAPPAEHLFQ